MDNSTPLIIHHVQSFVRDRTSDQTVQRRSANYRPNIWDYDFVQSLKSDCMGEMYNERAKKLKEDVRRMFDEAEGSLSRLELIDTIQRLGVGYHFEKEIKGALDTIVSIKYNEMFEEDNLCVTALRFRLLRQHGYEVSQDVFNNFKEKMEGGFNTSTDIEKDIEGMLSLYEASFHSLEGEHILDEAQEFTSRHLKDLKENINNIALAEQVNHALEIPYHWRMQRLECRWFIDIYKKKDDMNPLLLEFAKLDFNILQKTYQEDLKYASRWWRNLGLPTKLNFARDRLEEVFLWALEMIFEPQFGYFRRQITKAGSLVTTIDDIYDVYATLDELQLFTDAVERWDINVIDELPDYMKICFLALYNTANDMAYDILKEKAWNILPYLKNAWADLCNAYLVEAKWYYNGYTPTLEEYLNNAWISVSMPLGLTHAYFLMSQNLAKEAALECLKDYTDLIRCSSLIVRLLDDLGTSKEELERGDVPKSIQCYMHDAHVTEEVAREHIKHEIGETWKKMNKYLIARSPFSQPFISAAVGVVRIAHCVYQYGDGFGIPDGVNKDQVTLLFVEPIPLVEGQKDKLELTHCSAAG